MFKINDLRVNIILQLVLRLRYLIVPYPSCTIHHNVTQTKRPNLVRSSVEVFKTKAIRKRKNCRCIRRTFGECLAVSLRLRMYLAQCHNANLRRIVRTIYKSLGRLLFEHIAPLLFRGFCIGFESWLHLRGSMWAGKPHSGAAGGVR